MPILCILDSSLDEMTSSPKEKVSKKIMQKNVCDKKSTKLFSLEQPTSIDFTYPSPSGQSCDNFYATQATYDPSYELALNDIVGYSTIKNEESKIDEKNISAEAKDTRVETCTTYCIIIGVVILVIIGVIIGIVYFLIQHPKLARALHKAIEAEKDEKNATENKIQRS